MTTSMTLAFTMAMTTSTTLAQYSQPTLAPTYSPGNTSRNNDRGYGNFNENIVWMFMWVSTMVIFLVLPFCTSRRRRELCMQGIRERRWINDDEIDSPENGSSSIRADGQQQESRQQQREETQRHFQTTRTQEDEIRQQYLLYLMENYTMVSMLWCYLLFRTYDYVIAVCVK